MTEHEAARLAEIRADHPRRMAEHRGYDPWTVDLLLDMLDAAARPHDASFVTREKHDALYRENIRHQQRAETAERRVAELEADRQILIDGRNRLAAALAASEAKLGRVLRALEIAKAAIDDCHAYRSHHHFKALQEIAAISDMTGADELLARVVDSARAALGEEPADGDTERR